MKVGRTALILALLASIPAAIGCNSAASNTPAANTSVPADNSNSSRSNLEELSLMINIPVEAEDVVYKESADKKRLTAVLSFTPENAERVIVGSGSDKPTPADVSPESWFPDELTAQSETSGDNLLKGDAYSARQFLNDQYKSGLLVRIKGTDFFVLELSK